MLLWRCTVLLKRRNRRSPITLELEMQISNEMRRLHKKWSSGAGWPKRLEWIEVAGLRGWAGQRISFPYPIVAIVGENGSGKSTLLQAAASVYRSESPRRTRFPSEFFPKTTWDDVKDVVIKYGYQQGSDHLNGSIRKPTSRWLGNTERPVRSVEYIDLNRLQPVGTRVGYARIPKSKHKEASAVAFDDNQVQRFSAVMGRAYDSARMAFTDIDNTREVPVISKQGDSYSGFHQGSGEITVAELMRAELPKYGLVLIDEIESSLHPRAQRRLMRDLAERCRDSELQILLTTHSPYILEELPLEARMHILETGANKLVVPGVSPQFAMTKMDDEQHPECDLYVEDTTAKVLLGEILSAHGQDLFQRCIVVPFGATSVGQALGLMVDQNRFHRPTCVYLDGDSAQATGCILLPGEDAPEQVVFNGLQAKGWYDVWTRIGRDSSVVHDACNRAMTLGDHHNWITLAANEMKCGGEALWQAMCAEWVKHVLSKEEAKKIMYPIENVLS
jgi:predicted ATPase